MAVADEDGRQFGRGGCRIAGKTDAGHFRMLGAAELSLLLQLCFWRDERVFAVAQVCESVFKTVAGIYAVSEYAHGGHEQDQDEGRGNSFAELEADGRFPEFITGPCQDNAERDGEYLDIPGRRFAFDNSRKREDGPMP